MRGILATIGRCLLLFVCSCGGTTPGDPPAFANVSLQFTVATPGKTNQIGISGTALSPDHASLPTVSLVRTRDLAGNATTGPSFSARPASVVDTNTPPIQDLSVALTPDQTGIYALTLTTAAGTARLDEALLVFPVDGTTVPGPQVICIDTQDLTQTLQGTFITFNDGGRQDTRFAGASTGRTGLGQLFELQDCQGGTFSGIPYSACARMVLHFDHTYRQFAGQDVAVNVFTGNTGETLHVIMEGQVTIASFSADIYTVGQAVTLALSLDKPISSGIGPAPVVTMDGAPVHAAFDSCQAAVTGQLCRGLSVTVPAGTQPGLHAFAITTSAGCTGAGGAFTGHAAPKLLSAPQICKNAGQDVSVTGTDLFGVQPVIDGQLASGDGNCSDGSCLVLRPAVLPLGSHTLSASAQLDTVQTTNTIPFVVNPGPSSVGNPIPNLLLAGAARPVFLPIAGKSGAVQSANLSLVIGGGAALEAQAQDVDGGVVLTAADAGPGTYVVDIQDDTPCTSSGRPFLAFQGDAVLSAHDFSDGGQGVTFNGTTVLDDQNVATWSPTAGNPGGAVVAQANGGSPEYFFFGATGQVGADVGVLRFDLSACPFGNGDPQDLMPASVVFKGVNSTVGSSFTLTHAIGAPACASFTHYDLALGGGSGWTYADRTGSRPAAFGDFNQLLTSIQIQGNFWTTGNQVVLDNTSLELGQ